MIPPRKQAEEILARRGTGPRIYRNTLVFLAADRTRLAELEQGVRQYLAWRSIEEEKETLNLDAFQANQAKTKREGADASSSRARGFGCEKARNGAAPRLPGRSGHSPHSTRAEWVPSTAPGPGAGGE
jgi:hypothetical protein